MIHVAPLGLRRVGVGPAINMSPLWGYMGSFVNWYL